MRPVLVKLDVVCERLEKSADEVFDMAADGSALGDGLIWVFDLFRQGGCPPA